VYDALKYTRKDVLFVHAAGNDLKDIDFTVISVTLISKEFADVIF
jgi:hypothetical protein